MNEIIIKTIIAAEPRFSAAAIANRTAQLPRKNYGFYGFDLILLKTGEFKLLEVNANPSTGCESEVDFIIKKQLFRDLIALTTPKKYYIKNKLQIRTMAAENKTVDEKDTRNFSLKMKALREIYQSNDFKQKFAMQI